MLTIYDLVKSNELINNKLKNFNEFLKIQPLFIVIKPELYKYNNPSKRKYLENNIKKIVNSGLVNLEIPWQDNKNWKSLMINIKSKFPNINLGSASILNKKSIDDSINIGLNYSMMKFWDRNLFIYAKKKNHLLIPGISNIESLKEASLIGCKVIKIYPIEKNIKLINSSRLKHEITFIAAGGLSISNLKEFNNIGYKAIVIGDKGFINKKLDPKIFEWLQLKLKN